MKPENKTKTDELYSQEDIEKIKANLEVQTLILNYTYSTRVRLLGFILLVIIVLLGLAALVYSYIYYPDFRQNIASVLANNIVAAFIGLLVILNIYPKNDKS